MEIEKQQTANQDAPPKTNVFGEPLNAPAPEAGKPQATQTNDGGDKGKDDKGGDKKQYTEIPEDHPVLAKLRADSEKAIADIKEKYGNDLRGQRTVIETLDKQLKELTKGANGKKDSTVPFPSIKRSKDLSRAEREDMTDSELRAMDQMADIQDTLNALFTGFGEKFKSLEENFSKGLGDEKKTDPALFVREEALRLANNDRKQANEILESFNALKFSLDGLTEEEIAKRVELAYKNLPTYTPPKEQETKNGGPTKGAETKSDPFNVDSAIERAHQGQNSGSYEL